MSKLQEETGKFTQELREGCFDTTPEPVEKWSVGSYVVPLQDRLLTRDEPLIKGKPYQITKCIYNPYIMCERGSEINFRTSNNPETTEGIKWFATKSEAEEFAKTLVEEVKQPLKQAVHCKTQEEINYIREKFGHSKNTNQFEFYGEVAYYLDTKGFDKINDVKCKKNYQILSFQEWCDLNGYKMEKNVEFEAGKWYRVTDGTCKAVGKNIWYVKSPKLIKGIITCEEHIYHKINRGGNFGRLGEFTFTEVSIEEIQQYLPEEHPDKIKPGIKFEVGDWVVSVERSLSYNVNEICRVSKISKTHLACENKPQGESNMKPFDKFRHATPEEINSHLISIGQIPVGELLNTGIEPNKNGSYSCISINRGENPQCTFNSIKLNGQEILKPKMILSIDDEELPMVNIIKTNSIKQLLNND